jgi:hypothetical protein
MVWGGGLIFQNMKYYTFNSILDFFIVNVNIIKRFVKIAFLSINFLNFSPFINRIT